MKKILIVLFLVTCYLLLAAFGEPSLWRVTSVHAQEASISSSLSPDIKDKLKDLQSEIASKAAVLKTQISQKLANRAYMGTIKDISNSKLTLSTATGEKTVHINQDTDYFSKSGNSALKKSSFSILSTGDFIAGLGDVDESEVLTAQRLIKYITPPKFSKKVVWGRVQGVSKNLLILIDKNNQTIQVIINSDTEIDSQGSSTDLSNIKQGASIVISGDNGKTFSANLIYLFPKK